MLNGTHCHLPIYEPSKCTFFALGRNAMVAACQAFKLKPGDEILTPAFDCDGSLQPFRVLGLNLGFFRSHPDTFSVDIDDLKKGITSKTKLLHIVNHFGFPQPWEKLLSLSQEYGIPILEDNAYSLLSSYQGEPFGTFGDISIFSLRKNLPLLDGGLLRINNMRYNLELNLKKTQLFYKTELFSALNLFKLKIGLKKAPPVIKFMAKYFTSQIESPVPLYSDSEKNVPMWSGRDCIGKEFSCDYLRPMSRLARHQLSLYSAQDYGEIATKKREYYVFLVRQFESLKKVKILWPNLPNGVIPFSFSILIMNNRDVFLKQLQRKYDVMAWPTLSNSVLSQLENFSEVDYLGRKLFQINLPAHMVIAPKFSVYLENLVSDFYKLYQR